MRRLWNNRQGNFVVVFALISCVIFGGVGMAIDYSRALNVESFIQAQADAAALGGVQFGKDGDPSPYLQFVRSSTEARYGAGDWIDKLQVKGDWISATDFEVTVKGDVPVTILAAVPGFPDAVPVGVQATARLAEPSYVYKAPRVTQLDPEAADYNRISVYCYEPAKLGGDAEHESDDDDGDYHHNARYDDNDDYDHHSRYDDDDRYHHGGYDDDDDHDGGDDDDGHGVHKNAERTQMTVIADNAGTKYDYEMPRCEEGQYLSYKLLNVRDARTRPDLWDDEHAERYEYYTDTELKDGREEYALDEDILETVLCDTFEKCKPEGEGGVIPEGQEREPQLTKKACEPGKFMYYGWEDRPPGDGWTDRDYDDIRIIIECPTVEVVGERAVRLIN